MEFGSNHVNKLSLGSTPVSKLWLGSTLVYSGQEIVFGGLQARYAYDATTINFTVYHKAGDGTMTAVDSCAASVGGQSYGTMTHSGNAYTLTIPKNTGATDIQVTITATKGMFTMSRRFVQEFMNISFQFAKIGSNSANTFALYPNVSDYWPIEPGVLVDSLTLNTNCDLKLGLVITNNMGATCRIEKSKFRVYCAHSAASENWSQITGNITPDTLRYASYASDTLQYASNDYVEIVAGATMYIVLHNDYQLIYVEGTPGSLHQTTRGTTQRGDLTRISYDGSVVASASLNYTAPL